MGRGCQIKQWLPIILLVLPAIGAAENRLETSGKAGLELRLFPHSPQFAEQYDTSNLSGFFEPQFFYTWNDDADYVKFIPYLRWDQHDRERSHGDIRQLSWSHIGDDWELHSGINKVFWGVTEFQHLVDTINQTDGVEDIDGEDKLGQPMIHLSLARSWGILDLFALPGFRERTFAGTDGRLRSGLVVDTSQAAYESAAGDTHLDLAARWSRTLGDYDIGLHWFRGTNREPLLLPGTDGGGNPVLTPYYEQINQLGMDLQATLDDWLWKLEMRWRDGQRDSFWALQGGFEYTLYGIADSDTDLGLLLEYGWDERGTRSTSLAQNDLFFGARIALNDAESSELLAGIGYDLDYHSHSLQIEASSRIGSGWKASLDLRLFSGNELNDPLSALRRDDHLQLTLERYF
ncbi:hypothetical protein [Sedimenticola selenatireducens]|uniref:hypothetical protein n=1 Tax=Sedimenticola selenatireducens TaxID=191960 RepID=UPI003F4ACC61